ncbi:PREDICTED: uncharacterized protein LOC108564969 isoform X2 [Nicrophorus vespilloides]|uniref:Uncharacterized protein LOC108564969 isoform X2 n=1 Tax=Nicrophorus vespilloides TaxID=110193 RepID=A0ABM1MYM0_NICVS|nr:PREDICTED: uncharacterized protein LOC108564969 isoform X2 [Nicrophorus vespilloides]
MTTNTNYKKLQIDFLRWAAHGLCDDAGREPCTFDLPDLVNLLQAIGFRMRRADIQLEQSPLRGGQNGSKVVISCTNSGQRCILEQPNENCSCIKQSVDNAAKDSFWEIVATSREVGNSFLETGCAIFPSLSKDKLCFVRNILGYLLKAMNEPESVIEDSMKTPIRRSIGKRVGTPKQYDSPSRYRSLDTLLVTDEALPKPGILLPKMNLSDLSPTITQSSPNIKLDVSNNEPDFKCDSVPRATYLVNKATDLLMEARVLMNNKSVSDCTEKHSTILHSATKNFKKLICTSKPPNSTTNLMVSIPNLSKKKTSSTSSVNSTDGEFKIPTKVPNKAVKIVKRPDVPHPEAASKRISKYAHVKSTIPKIGDKKK